MKQDIEKLADVVSDWIGSDLFPSQVIQIEDIDRNDIKRLIYKILSELPKLGWRKK